MCAAVVDFCCCCLALSFPCLFVCFCFAFVVSIIHLFRDPLEVSFSRLTVFFSSGLFFVFFIFKDDAMLPRQLKLTVSDH